MSLYALNRFCLGNYLAYISAIYPIFRTTLFFSASYPIFRTTYYFGF